MKIGRKAGEFLLDSIKRAKRRLLIISPWLSPACAELVVRKQQRGVNVEILTTNDPSPSHQRALGELIETEKRIVRKANLPVKATGLVLVFTGILTFLAGFLQPHTLLISLTTVCAGVVVFWIGRARTERYLRPRIESLTIYDDVANPLVHAKVYVIDDVVAIGSPNFTVTGLQRSIEAVAFLHENGIADRVIEEITSLKNEPLHKVFSGRR